MWNETIFSVKNLVTFRYVPDPFEMELVPFQFHKNWNKFRNDLLRRFVTHNIGVGDIIADYIYS